MEKIIDPKQTEKVLFEIHKIFKKHKVHYWLDGGALLGIKRTGELLEYDHDVDLCVWEVSLKKFPYFTLIEHGFEVYFTDDKISIEKEGIPIKVSLYKEIHIKNSVDDYSVAYREYMMATNKLGELFRVIWWLGHVRVYQDNKSFKSRIAKLFTYEIKRLPFCKMDMWKVPLHFFKNLKTIDFKGKKFKVPKQTEKYLEFRYGKDWRVPKKKWCTYKQDGAINVHETV